MKPHYKSQKGTATLMIVPMSKIVMVIALAWAEEKARVLERVGISISARAPVRAITMKRRCATVNIFATKTALVRTRVQE